MVNSGTKVPIFCCKTVAKYPFVACNVAKLLQNRHSPQHRTKTKKEGRLLPLHPNRVPHTGHLVDPDGTLLPHFGHVIVVLALPLATLDELFLILPE